MAEPSARRGPGSRASGTRKIVPLAAPLAAPHVAKVPVREQLEILEGYRILARLGHGGMAEALLARGPEAGGAELVVVKRLHEHLEEDAQIVQMFVDEARLACQLHHIAIVRTLAVGALGGRRSIIMEFLDGQPLQRVVRRAHDRQVPLPVDLVAYWFLNALDGLHYAHEAKDDKDRSLRIVHRDVSPHNLFVTYEGTIKLLDFGIAKTAVQEGRTRTGLLKGKAAYMAPEQARAEIVDRRADIWSTGVVLWEALTGARLFKAEHEAGSLNLTLTLPIPSVSRWRRDVPPELEAILDRALQRNRDKRYPTASAMAQDLREFLMMRRASIRTSGRDLMSVLFAAEIPERRTRIRALLASSDTLPISSSLPAVTSTNISTGDAASVHQFVDTLQRRNRLTLVALMTAVMCLVAAGALLFAVAWRPAAVAGIAAPTAPAKQPQASPAPVGATLGATAGTGSSLAAEPSPPASTPASRSGRVDKKQSTSERNERPVGSRETTASSEATLEKPVPSPVREDGFLTLDTTPWSMVTVGGVALGQTPVVRARLPAGTHRLVLSNPELGRKTSYEVTIEPGKVTTRRVGLE
jgi:eukaryotic-like serine/threonine-protein kinase